MKKSIALLLAAVLLFSLTVPAAAADSYNITIRIEGITGNMFYRTISVPLVGNGLTVKDALAYADSQDDALTIAGLSGGYVTAINGVAAATYGGYDGWSYLVNSTEPSVGISDYSLNDGDSVVLYYGDPFGVGMQKPILDLSRLGAGILRFVSIDVTYDPITWEPTTTVNPVAGATVTFKGSFFIAQGPTNDNGEIPLEGDKHDVGIYSLEIEKYAPNGCPLVLRYAPDYTVTLVSKVTPLITGSNAPLAINSISNFLILRHGAATVGGLLEQLAPAAFVVSDGSTGSLLNYNDILYTGAAVLIMNGEGAAIDTKKIIVAGDVNGIAGVNIPDARAALRFAAGLDKPTAAQLAAADLDRNGKISMPEVRKILRVAAKLETFQPV